MSAAVVSLIERLGEADEHHRREIDRLIGGFASLTEADFPDRAHRRQLIADWQKLNVFGRLQAAGWQDKHRMVGLREVRCRAYEGAVVVEKRTVQIRAHRPLRDSARVSPPLAASELADWFEAGRDADALFAELSRSRLDLDGLPWVLGARFFYRDKFGRICGSLDGHMP